MSTTEPDTYFLLTIEEKKLIRNLKEMLVCYDA